MDETDSGRMPPGDQTNPDLASLFRDEYQPMLRMATLLVGAFAVAEEVVQDSFAVVGERWSLIDRPGGYLRTTVVNGCYQVLRRRSAEDRFGRLAINQDLTELPTHLVEIRDALGRLSDRQRIVVVLRYFVDIPDEDIAEILGTRPSTVRSLARRAFSILRKELS